MSKDAKPSAKFNLQGYSILIVDDTPVNLGVIVDYLESYGFGIRIARSGENALKRVHYDPPDIILLDVLMPGIDGFETCRRLKADETTKDIPVIFMTSLTSPEDRVRSRGCRLCNQTAASRRGSGSDYDPFAPSGFDPRLAGKKQTIGNQQSG